MLRSFARTLLTPHTRTQLTLLKARLDRAVLPALLPPADPAFARQTSEQVGVVGFHASSLGIGRGAALCARELAAAGLDVARIDPSLLIGVPTEGGARGLAVAPEGAPLVLQINPDVLAQVLAKLGRDPLKRRRLIGYWVYELPQAPKDWAPLAGLVHEIWAPSRFAAQALEARFRRPVAVVPHPVALDPPPPVTPAQRAAIRAGLNVTPEQTLVLSTFSAASSLARKNPLGAIEAFRRAFGGQRGGARLLLRCLHAEAHPAVTARLRQAVAEADADIVLLERSGRAADGLAEMTALYGACDIYLSLHRSEGFGLTMAEAMLAGRAVVATGWSGGLDFMDGTVSRLVPARLVPVQDAQGLYPSALGEWAEPDLDAAAAHLRDLAADARLRGELGALASRHIVRRLGGGDAAQRVRLKD